MRRRIFTYFISSTLSLAVLVSGAAPAAAQSATTADPSKKEFSAPDKSIAFYVGSDLSEDGHPLLGGFGHEPSSHWVEVGPAQEHPEDATITVGPLKVQIFPVNFRKFHRQTKHTGSSRQTTPNLRASLGH